MPALTRPQKIAFAEMRASSVRGLLIYCSQKYNIGLDCRIRIL
jgi:hypothetical protein